METTDAAESSDDSATAAVSDSAASEAQEASEDQTEDQTEETAPETSAMTDTVLDIVTPYYLAGGEVAQDSPEAKWLRTAPTSAVITRITSWSTP